MKQFTKKELELLSNFSSLEELETFTSKVDSSIEKLKAKAIALESEKPELLYGAGGALLGAGLGAGTSLLMGKDKKNKLRKALEAGALGAFLGVSGGVLAGAARGNSIREKLAKDRIEADARHKTVMEMLKNEPSLYPETIHDLTYEAPQSAEEVNALINIAGLSGHATTMSPYASEAIQNIQKEAGKY